MPLLTSINPVDYSINGQLNSTSAKEIDNLIASAKKAQCIWGSIDLIKRLKYVKNLTDILRKNIDQIADMIVSEIGTIRSDCIDELMWDFDYIDWWLENAGKYLAPEITYEDDLSLHQVLHEPIGVMAVITPWNLPFDMFVWGVIPNLIVGNTVIYKSAEQCVLTGELLARLVSQSNLPEGVFGSVLGGAFEGNHLVNGDIDGIWFTGSSSVGMDLAQIAGRRIIRTSLELGGSNPAIVFSDYDLDKAADRIISKRMFNSGQTCDAVKRVLVEKSVFEKMIEKLKIRVQSIDVGSPNNEGAKMGPLVSKKQKEIAEKQMSESLKMGAEIVAQGRLIAISDGPFVLPTLLTNINENMPVWNQEVFAPLLPVMSFETEEEAIRMANNTEYGLGALIYSGDCDRALRVARRIEAGALEGRYPVKCNIILNE